jgi:hypothetical protein
MKVCFRVIYMYDTHLRITRALKEYIIKTKWKCLDLNLIDQRAIITLQYHTASSMVNKYYNTIHTHMTYLF